MQRLFSTFASGWPGVGLFFQRLLIAVTLVHLAMSRLIEISDFVSISPYLIGATAGILLLLGLWTPIVGSLIAVVETWIAFSRPVDPWTPIMLAILAATLAMIGPGAWSIDARLFGREHIEIGRH